MLIKWAGMRGKGTSTLSYLVTAQLLCSHALELLTAGPAAARQGPYAGSCAHLIQTATQQVSCTTC